MKKLTWNELLQTISEHNKANDVKSQFEDEHVLNCVVVFKSENWPDRDYSLESRSYAFRSDNKYFIPEMCGRSIYADSLDGSDRNVRLDYYLSWDVDYCYIA